MFAYQYPMIISDRNNNNNSSQKKKKKGRIEKWTNNKFLLKINKINQQNERETPPTLNWIMLPFATLRQWKHLQGVWGPSPDRDRSSASFSSPISRSIWTFFKHKNIYLFERKSALSRRRRRWGEKGIECDLLSVPVWTSERANNEPDSQHPSRKYIQW